MRRPHRYGAPLAGQWCELGPALARWLALEDEIPVQAHFHKIKVWDSTHEIEARIVLQSDLVLPLSGVSVKQGWSGQSPEQRTSSSWP